MKLTLFATITLLAIHQNCSGSEKPETIIFHEIMPSGTRMTIFSDDSMIAKFSYGKHVVRFSDKTQILIPLPEDTTFYTENPQGVMSTYPIHSIPKDLGDPATCFLGSHKFGLLRKKIKEDNQKDSVKNQTNSKMETRSIK